MNYKWDVERVLKAVLWPADVEAVLKLPLGRRDYEDKIIWHFDKNGRYLVKFNYKVALESKVQAGSSSRNGLRNWWQKYLWRLRIPNKIKILIWRAFRGILPSSGNRRRRGVDCDQQCRLGREENEWLKHALMGLPGSQECIGEVSYIAELGVGVGGPLKFFVLLNLLQKYFNFVIYTH